MLKPITVFLLILLGGAAPAMAQGVNCSTPEPIVGEVSLRWVAAPPLNSTGSMVPAYFQWTAPIAGDYWFDTQFAIGGTTLSAGIDSGCSTVFTHSVNGGQGNGLTLVGVQAGDSYLVNSEVVNTFGHPANEGTLNVVRLTGACQGLTDDAHEPNDGSYQGSSLEVGSYIGLWAGNQDWDYYTTCLAPGATMQVDAMFSHVDGNLDLDLAVLDPVLPQYFGAIVVSDSFTDNEQVIYTNTTGRSITVSVRVRFTNWSYQERCIPYSLLVSGVGNCPWSASTFCDPMDQNSTGQSTRLNAVVVPGTVDRVHFDADQGPPSQFGYILVGNGFSDPGISLGQGRLCLSTSVTSFVYRFNLAGTPFNSLGRFQPDGTLGNISGTSATGSGYDLPTTLPSPFNPDGQLILSGRSWYFQLWHRDVGGQSNFSNGVQIDF